MKETRPRRKQPLKVPELTPKPPLYDGNLIYRAEGSLESDVYFYDRESDNIFDCTNFVTQQARELLRSTARSPLTHVQRTRVKENLAQEKEAFSEAHGERIASIIEEGKLRLHILLNASRGNEYDYHKLLDLMEYVRSKQGRIDAYGKEKVQGYPALVFLQADTRYALARSDFKWFLDWYQHDLNSADYQTSDAYKKARAERDQKASNQNDLTRKLLLGAALKDKQKALRERLHRSPGAMKIPPEYPFTGHELLEFGIAHRLFSDLPTLKHKFSRNLAE